MSEFSRLIEPESLVRQIESFGFALYVGDDGVVHGRPVEPGKKVPWEMRPLLEQLRVQNDAVAAVVRNADRTVDLQDISQAEAAPWIEKVKEKQYRLVPGTQVVYNKTRKTVSMKLERVDLNGRENSA